MIESFKKYLVNPFSDAAEWTHDEFRRISDYLWEMTDKLETDFADELSAKLHSHDGVDGSVQIDYSNLINKPPLTMDINANLHDTTVPVGGSLSRAEIELIVPLPWPKSFAIREDGGKLFIIFYDSVDDRLYVIKTAEAI